MWKRRYSHQHFSTSAFQLFWLTGWQAEMLTGLRGGVMGKVVKKVKTVPEMLPRERLTRKALAAIEAYSMVRAKGVPVHYWMVRYVLEAERMRRVDLYAWLEARGYRWLAHPGRWIKKGGDAG